MGVADIVGALLSLIGGVCFGVSLGTNYWYTYSGSAVGLFQQCTGNACIYLGWDNAPLRIVIPKGFMVGGAIFLGIGFFFHMSGLCCKDQKTRGGLTIAGSTFYIFASLMILCAPATMIGFVELDNTLTEFSAGFLTLSIPLVYGYSFYLAWASAGLLFVGSIISCIGGCSAKSDVQVVVPQQVVWSTQAPQAMVFTQTHPAAMIQQVPQPPTTVQAQFRQTDLQW